MGNEIQCEAKMYLREMPPWYNANNIKQMNGWKGCYIYDEHWSTEENKDICWFSLEINDVNTQICEDSVVHITIHSGWSKYVDVDLFKKIVEELRPYISKHDTSDVIGHCEDEDGHAENNFEIYLNESLVKNNEKEIPVYCYRCLLNSSFICPYSDNCERVFRIGLESQQPQP